MIFDESSEYGQRILDLSGIVGTLMDSEANYSKCSIVDTLKELAEYAIELIGVVKHERCDSDFYRGE